MELRVNNNLKVNGRVNPVVKKIQKKHARRRAMLRRRIATLTILSLVAIPALFKVGATIIENANPRNVLLTYDTTKMSIDRDEHKYFYNFIEDIENANKFDSRDLLRFVMEINGLDEVEDFYRQSSLEVPVIK